MTIIAVGSTGRCSEPGMASRGVFRVVRGPVLSGLEPPAGGKREMAGLVAG